MSVPGRPKQEIVTIQFETKKGVKSPVFGGKHGKQEVDPFVLEAPEGQEIIGLFGLSYARDGMIGDETLIAHIPHPQLSHKLSPSRDLSKNT